LTSTKKKNGTSWTSGPEIVSTEITRDLELLEQRLDLLGSLSAALTAARSDIVSLDISSFESRIADQQRLCVEIGSLDTQLDRVQRQCATHLTHSGEKAPNSALDSDATRRRETIERLARVQASVQKLNAEHQALLRRSRRTVNALLNSYHTFALTYSNPADHNASAAEGL
jgi:hypothetical protein